MSRYFAAVVTARRYLTERILELQLSLPDGKPLPLAEAGSHIELRFGGAAGRFLRHYSIVGPLVFDQDIREPYWRIAVQRENRPRGSAFIHDQFRVGTELEISHPLNAFRLLRRQAHTLLIAGGIGITPILPMARSLRIRKESFSMFYAGQHCPGMAFVEEAKQIAGPNLTIHETAHQGLPDLKLLLESQSADTIAYICGPSPMIQAVRDAAHELGWDDRRIRYEVFNAAHRHDDGAFDVRLKTGRIIHVGAGITILDALEASGIDTLSDCRRGECGLCATDIAQAHEGIDHRDKYLNPREKEQNTQVCICCSRAQGSLLELDIA